jgi:hypothetical protein
MVEFVGLTDILKRPLKGRLFDAPWLQAHLVSFKVINLTIPNKLKG